MDWNTDTSNRSREESILSAKFTILSYFIVLFVVIGQIIILGTLYIWTIGLIVIPMIYYYFNKVLPYDGKIFMNMFYSYDTKYLNRVSKYRGLRYTNNNLEVRTFRLFIRGLLNDFNDIEKEYETFKYQNVIEQHRSSYVFQLYFLFNNNIEHFIELKKTDNLTRTRNLEDNIEVSKPEKISIDNRNYIIDLDIFEKVYQLYTNQISETYFDELSYPYPVYNFIKERAMYKYYENTEQVDKQHKYRENSTYILDEFLEEQQ